VLPPVSEARVSCFSPSELHSCSFNSLPLSVGEILMCYIHCAGYWRKSLGLKPTELFRVSDGGGCLSLWFLYIIELVLVLNIAEILLGGRYAIINQSKNIYTHVQCVLQTEIWYNDN